MNLLTRRIPTILGIVLLLAIFGVGYYYLQAKTPKTSQETTPKKVRITNIADNKFSVSWVTDIATPGSVEYGLVGEKITTKVSDDRDKTDKNTPYQTHHVTIEGLQPSSQYAFRILSGDNLVRFDNTGSPYTVSTGPVIGATPTSANFYGNVQQPSKVPAAGSIVYLTLPSSATVSTIASETGSYAFTLSTIRSADLRSYVTYDPAASVASLTVESGKDQSVSSVSLANSAPVPLITLGEDANFMNQANAPQVAEVVPQSSSTPTPTMKAETPSIFNVEPLAESADINAVTTNSIVLLNPKEIGETLKTLRPEFRGTAPAKSTLSIAIKGQKAVSDTVEVEADGTWSWAPVVDLKVGKQTVTVSTVGTGGTTIKVEREFIVSNSPTGLDPAFVSSPSGSTKASASPSATSTASATPRVAMPATDSGVPVTGVIENTVITAGLGIVIMVLGAVLLAL